MSEFASNEKAFQWKDLMTQISKLNQLDYSKSIYVSSKTPLIITCKLHGDFTVKPNDHQNKKSGCPQCRNEIISLQKTIFDKLFFEKANKKHNSRFDYSKTVYTGYKNNLTIICSVHGEFETTPYQHLRNKAGCSECGKEMNKGKYCLTLAKRNVKKYKLIPAIIYHMHCSNEQESFFKIGVTINSVRVRVDAIPYKCKIVKEINDNLYNAIVRESAIKERLKEFRYTPFIKFGGHTECFSSLNIH